MVLKTIVLLLPRSNDCFTVSSSNSSSSSDNDASTADKNAVSPWTTATWKISSQQGLETVLRRYGVMALVDAEYACHVTQYAALVPGAHYFLGEKTCAVELHTYKKY